MRTAGHEEGGGNGGRDRAFELKAEKEERARGRRVEPRDNRESCACRMRGFQTWGLNGCGDLITCNYGKFIHT